MPFDFSGLHIGQMFPPDQWPFAKKRQEMMAQPQDMINSPIDTMQQIYQPQHQAADMFSEALRNMPTQENQPEPGMLRKIASVIVGMGTGGPAGESHGSLIGYKAGSPEEQSRAQDNVLYPELGRQRADWGVKTKFLGQAADDERLSNAQQRIFANESMTRQQNQSRLTETERRDRAREAARIEENNIRSRRADAYAAAQKFKIEHPNYESKIRDEDGMLVYIDKNNPSAEPVETGITQLTPLEKINAGVTGALRKIAASGAEARKTKETIPGVNVEAATEIENVKQAGKEKIQGMPGRTRSATDKPATPFAEAKSRLNRAQELLNSRPDLKPYIKVVNGKVTGDLTEPFFNADQAKREEARKYIYGLGSNQQKEEIPKGAKPGGKWHDTKFGRVYEEP